MRYILRSLACLLALSLMTGCFAVEISVSDTPTKATATTTTVTVGADTFRPSSSTGTTTATTSAATVTSTTAPTTTRTTTAKPQTAATTKTAKTTTTTKTTTAKPTTTTTVSTVQYTMPDGTVLTIPADVNATQYTLEQANKPVTRPHAAIEDEILRLINIERANHGLAPLTMQTNAHYFAMKRAEESASTFSHTRPNGKDWHTVYTDDHVALHGAWGENLYTCTGVIAEDKVAQMAVTGWMNSPGHRANILSEDYTSVAIALYSDTVGMQDNVDHYVAVQNFFG